jgi:hypothetical protein
MFLFGTESYRMIEMYDAGGTGSQMAPQTLEIPQNRLANGAGLARRFGALAGSGVSATPTIFRQLRPKRHQGWLGHAAER